MSSKFNIINLALRKLGQDPITALGEDTENYRKVDDVYDLKLRALLRMHPWSFAKKEVELTASSDTPVLSDDFSYIFPLPSDFVRLNKTNLDPTYPFKIKGRKLYSESSEISIEYGYFLTDPDAWVTSHSYSVGDIVLQSNTVYYCETAHSSGTFATDLAASKWVEHELYDASFVDAFATDLAYELCMPITKDAKLKEVLGNELRLKINIAKSLNGQEVTPDSPNASQWLNSR